jgi:hypothetical protein
MGTGLFWRYRLDALVIRRNVEHAYARTVLRGRKLYTLFRRLTRGAIDSDRRAARIPYLMEQRTACSTDALHARHGAILLNDGTALRIVAGNHASHG